MPRVKKTLDEYFKSSKIELGQHLNGTYCTCCTCSCVHVCVRVFAFIHVLVCERRSVLVCISVCFVYVHM